MELQFFCENCGRAHDDPADARLGHLVTCLDCEIETSNEHAWVPAAIEIEASPLAA